MSQILQMCMYRQGCRERLRSRCRDGSNSGPSLLVTKGCQYGVNRLLMSRGGAATPRQNLAVALREYLLIVSFNYVLINCLPSIQTSLTSQAEVVLFHHREYTNVRSHPVDQLQRQSPTHFDPIRHTDILLCYQSRHLPWPSSARVSCNEVIIHIEAPLEYSSMALEHRVANFRLPN